MMGQPSSSCRQNHSVLSVIGITEVARVCARAQNGSLNLIPCILRTANKCSEGYSVVSNGADAGSLGDEKKQKRTGANWGAELEKCSFRKRAGGAAHCWRSSCGGGGSSNASPNGSCGARPRLSRRRGRCSFPGWRHPGARRATAGSRSAGSSSRAAAVCWRRSMRAGCATRMLRMMGHCRERLP